MAAPPSRRHRRHPRRGVRRCRPRRGGSAVAARGAQRRLRRPPCSPASTWRATSIRAAPRSTGGRPRAPGSPSPSSRPPRARTTPTRTSPPTGPRRRTPGSTAAPTTSPARPCRSAPRSTRRGTSSRRTGTMTGAPRPPRCPRPRGDRRPRSERPGGLDPDLARRGPAAHRQGARSSTSATTSGATTSGTPPTSVPTTASGCRATRPTRTPPPSGRWSPPAGHLDLLAVHELRHGARHLGIGRRQPLLLRRRQPRRRLGRQRGGAGNPFGNLESRRPASRGPSPSRAGRSIPTPRAASACTSTSTGCGPVRSPPTWPVRTWARPIPGWNANHGFALNVPSAPGHHRVCAYASTSASGSTNPAARLLDGRRQPVREPRRRLVALGGQLTVVGLGARPRHHRVDPGRPVRRRGDGRPVRHRGAPSRRRLRLRLGHARGYAAAIPVACRPAPHEVCAYAINVGSGTTNPNARVSHGDRPRRRSRRAASRTPTRRRQGAVRVQGWALRRRHSRPRSPCTCTSTATGPVRPPPTSPGATSARPSR